MVLGSKDDATHTRLFAHPCPLSAVQTAGVEQNPDMSVNGSENTTIPISVATIGSIVAMIPALLASTLSRPSVYARKGITAVITAVRKQKTIRNPKSAALENR